MLNFNKQTMINCLIDNFRYVQERIDEIKKNDNIDIKQISDLQRYTEMHVNIATTIKQSIIEPRK